jgi:hypothetical protein
VNEQHKNNGWPSRDEIVGTGATGPAALAGEGYLETVRAMDLIMAPGQVTEFRAQGVSTLDYRRPSLKELRARQTPEQKRVVAYHEAGHAAMMFMFRMHYNIVSIDMQGTLAVTGEVRTAEPDAWIPVIRDLSPDVPSDLRSEFILDGKRLMMVYLAGYAAEHRLCPSANGHWLEEQFNTAEWDESDPHDRHDIARAIRIAKALRGDNRNATRLLRQMGAWTDEAFSHPKLWAVVVALAEQLVAVKTRMGGNRVCKIMDNAWNEAGVPCLKMGRKWRQRFSMKAQPALHA